MTRKLTKKQTEWLTLARDGVEGLEDGQVELVGGRRKGTEYTRKSEPACWPQGAADLVDRGILVFVDWEIQQTGSKPWFGWVFELTPAGRALAATL